MCFCVNKTDSIKHIYMKKSFYNCISNELNETLLKYDLDKKKWVGGTGV